jgi:hypothetical protein
MSTRPDSRGTVTANSYVQLENKTWVAVQKWHKLCPTASWFVYTTNRLYHRDSKPRAKKRTPRPSPANTPPPSSFYVFDEASAVSDKIFEVAEGGLSDGHPFIFLYGNFGACQK